MRTSACRSDSLGAATMNRSAPSERAARSAFTWLSRVLTAKAAFSGPEAQGNGKQIPAEEVDSLRQEVLRNLIDETLQIQAAKTEKVEWKASDIDRTIERVAANVKQTPDQLAKFLESNGSSIRSLRRQVEAEAAWQRRQH